MDNEDTKPYLPVTFASYSDVKNIKIIKDVRDIRDIRLIRVSIAGLRENESQKTKLYPCHESNMLTGNKMK